MKSNETIAGSDINKKHFIHLNGMLSQKGKVNPHLKKLSLTEIAKSLVYIFGNIYYLWAFSNQFDK